MLLRLAIAAAAIAAVALLAYLWRRPPSRLRRLNLSGLGVRGPAVVQFAMHSCAPCVSAEPDLRAAAEDAGVPYQRIDVGEDPDVARRYGIRRVPTIAVSGRGGKVVGVWTSLPSNGEIAESARRARQASRSNL